VSKLRDRLMHLLGLARIRPEEEGDDTRLNEARNASFLLLRTCAEHKVRIKFILPGDKTEAPSDKGASMPPNWGTKAAPGPWGDPSEPPIDFDSFLSEMFRKATQDRIREEAAKRSKARAAEEERERAKAQRPETVTDPPFTRPQSRGSRRPYGARGSQPPLIVSSYEAFCFKCQQRIPIGSKVWWVRSVGTAHEACGYQEMVDIAEG
jgi:hypothetical protein